jgi:hypothetical protein
MGFVCLPALRRTHLFEGRTFLLVRELQVLHEAQPQQLELPVKRNSAAR